MEHLGQPQGFYISLGNTKVSLKVLGSAMEHLGQPQGSWVSLKVLGSAMTDLSIPWLIQVP
jgi:hypothetical protein